MDVIIAKVEFDLENKSLKNLRKQFQKHGVFYSSTDLALKLKALLPNNGEDATEIYDPTCGGGSLLAVFGDHVKKYGQELDPNQAQYCRGNLVNAEIAEGDTLVNPAFADKKFKYIIANPPFSVKWEQLPNDPRFSVAPALAPRGKADYAFILHCLHYLADDGTAVILGSHGPLFRSNADGKIRQWLIEQNYVDKLISFAPGHFEDTSIATVAWVLKKCRSKTSIVFEDTVCNKGRVVEFDEIAKKDFDLSFIRYIKAEPDVYVDIDPLERMKEFRGHLIELVSVCLQTEKMLQNGAHCGVFNLKRLKDELYKVIDSVQDTKKPGEK